MKENLIKNNEKFTEFILNDILMNNIQLIDHLEYQNFFKKIIQVIFF